LVTLQGGWGWSLFGCIWGIAIIGITFKLFFTGKHEKLSLCLYLLMGWLIIIAIHPLVQNLPFLGLVFLVCGGVFYTAGIIFYVKDETYKYAHSIWHLFVLAGSICHFFAILGYVVLVN
jgi:hemolysin III